MEKKREKISNRDLLIRYALEKCQSGIGTHVAEDEFKEFLKKMLEKINNNVCSTKEYYVEDEEFTDICNEIIKFRKIGHNGYEGYKIKDGKLYITNSLYYGSINDLYNTPQDVKNYFSSYFSLEKKKKTEISSFDLSKVSQDTLILSKQISAYLVIDLMKKYIHLLTEERKWPFQCDDVIKYIIEKDLPSMIEGLEGTRETFIKLYNHSIKSISEMISNNQSLVISNNDNNLLPYFNFRKIVAPFSFLIKFKYNIYKYFNNEITIKIENGIANLETNKLIFSDPYGDFSDEYENRKFTLNSNQSETLENTIALIKF